MDATTDLHAQRDIEEAVRAVGYVAADLDTARRYQDIERARQALIDLGATATAYARALDPAVAAIVADRQYLVDVLVAEARAHPWVWDDDFD